MLPSPQKKKKKNHSQMDLDFLRNLPEVLIT